MTITVWSILTAWLLTDAVATYGVLHHRRAFAPAAPLEIEPKAALLVALKGLSGTTALFLEALRSQRYRNFRVVFGVESSSDEALVALTNFQRELAGTIEVTIVVAGESTQRAQKVHNLLAALDTLRADDRLVVFADADIVPNATWLAELAQPIVNGTTPASCGYRWQLPTGRDWPSVVAAAADMSIATTARSRRWNLCWGGSVALDRAALDSLDVGKIWDRTASDDLSLTAALRARGLRIYVPPRILVPSPVSYRWSDLPRFIRRQYFLVRVYAPGHWLLAAWTLCLPTVAAVIAAILALGGHIWALACLALSVLLLQLRLSIRASIAAIVLPADDADVAKTTVRFARWAWPLIHLTHVMGFLSSACGRQFSWAGIRYCLVSRKVVLVQREWRGLSASRTCGAKENRGL